MKFVSGLKLF